jgi:hypothetical protein
MPSSESTRSTVVHLHPYRAYREIEPSLVKIRTGAEILLPSNFQEGSSSSFFLYAMVS